MFVKQATFHVGITDCCDSSTPESAGGVTTQQWRALITQCRRVYPRAQLQASSIIPAVGRNPLNTIIRPSNDRLQEACAALGVKYIDHCATFTTPSGAPRKALYNNAIQPSRKGTERVAQNLFPQRRPPLLPTPTSRHTSPVSTNTGPVKSPLLPAPLTLTDFPMLPSDQRPTPPSSIWSKHPRQASKHPLVAENTAPVTDLWRGRTVSAERSNHQPSERRHAEKKADTSPASGLYETQTANTGHCVHQSSRMPQGHWAPSVQPTQPGVTSTGHWTAPPPPWLFNPNVPPPPPPPPPSHPCRYWQQYAPPQQYPWFWPITGMRH